VEILEYKKDTAGTTELSRPVHVTQPWWCLRREGAMLPTPLANKNWLLLKLDCRSLYIVVVLSAVRLGMVRDRV